MSFNVSEANDKNSAYKMSFNVSEANEWVSLAMQKYLE